jgi:hypothetical protein
MSGLVQALVLAPVLDLDAAGRVQDADRRPWVTTHSGAGTESQGDLFLAVHEGRLRAAGDHTSSAPRVGARELDAKRVCRSLLFRSAQRPTREVC